MYKLMKKVSPKAAYDVVLRVEDGAVIPCIEDNTDYQQYLKWLEEGNTPEPADEQGA
jgi:thiamine biosynthesis protein ThiC